MATNITSIVSIIDNLYAYSYGVVWTGTSPVGTLSAQSSNDYKQLANGQPDPNNPGTWNTMPLSLNGTLVTTIPISGNTGNGMIDIDASGCFAVRLLYTAGSGTGAMTATLNAKVT
jgi:hypothetical protein